MCVFLWFLSYDCLKIENICKGPRRLLEEQNMTELPLCVTLRDTQPWEQLARGLKWNSSFPMHHSVQCFLCSESILRHAIQVNVSAQEVHKQKSPEQAFCNDIMMPIQLPTQNMTGFIEYACQSTRYLQNFQKFQWFWTNAGNINISKISEISNISIGFGPMLEIAIFPKFSKFLKFPKFP